MQIGVFSVSDITRDPVTGRMPTEGERIQAAVAIAKKVEEIGMDVYATGEHHNPPFYASSPTNSESPIALANITTAIALIPHCSAPWDTGEKYKPARRHTSSAIATNPSATRNVPSAEGLNAGRGPWANSPGSWGMAARLPSLPPAAQYKCTMLMQVKTPTIHRAMTKLMAGAP